MNPTHPGNEPEPAEMSTEPGTMPTGGPVEHGLPDGQAEKLGGFA